MGYYSDWEGEITITPPIPWKDIKDSVWLPEKVRNYSGNYENRDLCFRTDGEVVETDQGTLIKKEAVAVVVAYAEHGKNYHVVENLQDILNAHPDHHFTGFFEALGEDGERWRVVITSKRQALSIAPELVWPEVP